MEQPIAITGIGVVSPIGTGREAFTEGLLGGRDGVGPITRFGGAGLPDDLAGGLAAEIAEFDPKLFLGKKGLRRMDRTSLLAGSAARLAIDDARLEGVYPPDRIGVALGSTYGVIDNIFAFDRDALEDGPVYVNPMDFPNTVYNAPASRIAIFCKITGPTSTLATGTPSGLDALLYGADFLRLERARAFLVGGAYGLNPDTFWMFHHAGLLAPPPTGGAGRSGPYGSGRCGLFLGEGAGILTLERLDEARQRNAEVRAVLSGGATCFDVGPSGVPGPSAAVGARAIEGAIEEAGTSAESIGIILGGANGSKQGDLAEAEALGEVFGSRLPKIPVFPVKGLTGECLDASGAFQVAAAVVFIEGGRPSVSHLGETDPACGPLNLTGDGESTSPDHVLVVSLSETGGAAAAVISRRPTS